MREAGMQKVLNNRPYPSPLRLTFNLIKIQGIDKF